MNCSFHRKEQRYPTSGRDHALSFGFSYDFLHESKGWFQIFILPSNFQLFRGNSQSAFVWTVAIVSQPGCVFMLSSPRELQEDFDQNKYTMRAATSVLQFHLTLRESNLPVFKLRSLHILIQGRTFIHLISRLRVPDDLGHTHVRDCEPRTLSTDSTTFCKQASYFQAAYTRAFLSSSEVQICCDHQHQERAPFLTLHYTFLGFYLERII